MCDVCTYKSMQLYKRDTPGPWPNNRAFGGEEHVETGMLVLTDSKVSGKPWNSQWCKNFKGSCPDKHWEESKLVLEPWIITSFAALHPKSVYMDKWMCVNTIEHDKRKGFFFCIHVDLIWLLGFWTTHIDFHRVHPSNSGSNITKIWEIKHGILTEIYHEYDHIDSKRSHIIL